ncbi:tape measure protein [Mycobacterium phage Nairb]|uniref:Tape measure protein n=3 Tax=Bernalvirus bernal13 TaxID=1982102 RepID=A0A2P1JRN0_9CAUD|nr:tail length tape measure protein [Mycobacterium phage Bernal13]AHY26933.1 tape measure protein [Mycobacterium phage Bernal13]AVO21805.1 tape measure protein [Mycobacterium phage Nairb]QHB47423.1 tape measure protein [Mycobacterium phage Whitty]
MPTYDAGDARLQIFPDASGFKRRLESDLKKIQVNFDNIKTSADTSGAARDLERFRAEQQRNPVDLRVRVDTDSARGNVSQLVGDLGKLRSAGVINLGVLGVGSLPAAATAVAALATSVQQLSQAGLAVPGMLGGIAAVASTAKVGLSGVSDAFDALNKASDGTPKSIEAANEALSKLAPSAAEAVRAAADIKQQLKDALVLPTQQNLFDGLGDSARKVVSADLPILQRGMAATASAINSNLKQLATSLSSGSSQGFLDRIFGNTADAQSRLSKAIDPAVHAFGTLAAAGSDTLPRLADGVGRLAERFDNFITTADADGRLDKWINDGIDAVGHLGETILNLGKSFTAVTQAAGTGGLLSTLDSLSGKLATFLNSDAGQAKLRQFFQDGKDQLAQWGPILGDIAKSLPAVLTAAKEWTDQLLPPLKEITGFLADSPGLIQGVATAFIAWKSIDGVTNLLGSLGNLDRALGTPGGKGGKGGSGILGKLALASALGIGVSTLAPSLDGNQPPSAGDVAGDLATNVGGGALAGAQVAGVPGAIVGGGVGVGKTIYDRAAGDLDRGKQAAQQQAEANRAAGPNRAGAPEQQQAAVPALRGVQQPSLYNPDGSLKPDFGQQALDQVRAGKIPGFTVAPDGTTIIGPNGQPLQLQPGKAAGGILPGYSPGVDNLLVPMSGGEGVIIPQVTRQLGPAGIAAINAGVLTRGYAGGGIVDPFGNPVTPGAAPGPVAPNPTSGGGLDIVGSIAQGIGGTVGNLVNLGGAVAGGAGGQKSLADRFAGVPGIWGAIASANSSNPGENLTAWGKQTGQWLGGFAARTVGGFGNALWSGALSLFGLENSILSPNNPYFQDIARSAGFALDADGPLGALLGVNDDSSESATAATPKQLREALDSIADKDAAVAIAQARLSELSPDAAQSTRLAAQQSLDKAQRDAQQARDDYAALSSGGAATVGISSTSHHGGGVGSAPAPTSGSGAERWRPVVRAALLKYGPQYGITNIQAWEDAMVRQIQTESGGNPAAFNDHDSNGRGGTQTVAGIAQFLRSTFDANNITGGDYLDPTAQIAAMIPYVARRYGVDANGAPLGIGRGHGYASGGIVDRARLTPMSGGEGIIDPKVTAKLGPAGIAAINRGVLTKGFALGGIIPEGVVLPKQPTPPSPRTPATIQRLNPRPAPASAPARGAAVIPSAPTVPLPSPVAPPADSTPPQPAQSNSPATAALPTYTVSPNPADSLNHNLPAIDKGISSAAQAIGTAVSTAISAAGGAAGGFGGGAAGAIGPLVGGLIQEGGKVVSDVVNVGSSFLVGNVTPGTTASQYGELMQSPQNVPQTAQDNRRSYVFNGIDSRNVVDELRLKDAQDTQAELARFRG